MTAEFAPDFSEPEEPQQDTPTPGTLSYLFSQEDWQVVNENEQARIDHIHEKCSQAAIRLYNQEYSELYAEWWPWWYENERKNRGE